MAGDKTYITDGQGKLHRATRVHAVTPTDIVWSSNPNDYTVQVKIDGKWHRAVLTMDAGSSTFFDNINIDKALVTGADGKQHTALIVKPESTVTLSDIKTDTHGTIAGTTTGETAVSTYSENWSNVKWQDNVNVYKVLVTGSDGKVHTALLTTSAGGGVQVIVLGPSPLLLPDAVAHSLLYVKAFGGTEQNGTPTPDTPVDIVSNNGVLKYSKNLLDMATENIVLGKYINNSGVVTDSVPNFYNSKYIPVVAEGTYTWSTSSSINYFSVMEYGSDYAFKKRTLFINAGTSGSITLRSDTAFVLIGSNMDGTDVTLDKIAAVDWQFEKGSSATAYKPYGQIYTDGTVETINVHGKNLFDKNASYALFDGYLTNASIGQNTTLTAYSGGDKTIIIKVVPNTTYTVTRATNLGSVYNRIRCAAFTTLPENRSDGVILCNYINTTQANATFTTLSDTQYVAINVRNSGAVGDDWTKFVDAFQLEQGDTATEYQPYYDGGTATAEMLLKVGNYQDEQEILSGVVTRKVGVKVLDGTENFEIATATNCYSLTNTLGTGNFSDRTVYCTHFGNTSTLPGTGDRQGLAFIVNKGPEYTIAFGATTQFSTQALWKQWLADQYAAGTPVIVVYPLATATTESVTGQALQVTGGDNVLEITQAALSGLELEAKYTKVA